MDPDIFNERERKILSRVQFHTLCKLYILIYHVYDEHNKATKNSLIYSNYLPVVFQMDEFHSFWFCEDQNKVEI